MTIAREHPPALEPTPEWLASRRDHLLAEIAAAPEIPARRRQARRLVLVAGTVALLAAGAALAAGGQGLLDWLRSSEPGEARFLVDRSRTVSWPAPGSIACAAPTAGGLECAAGTDGAWTYALLFRVEPVPAITRESLLGNLARAEAAGVVDASRAEAVRAQIAAVDDDFIERLALLSEVASVGVGSGVSSETGEEMQLVPPAGVPQLVTCEPGDGGGFRCRPLAAGVVPVGAPIYALEEDDRWVERPAPAEEAAPALAVEDLFGRELTAAEDRLLRTLMTIGAESGGAGSAGASEPEEAGPPGDG